MSADRRHGCCKAQALTYPEVSTEADYLLLGPVAELPFPGFGVFKLYPADNYDAHIGGRYTVYDFGMIDATVDVAKSRGTVSRVTRLS